MQLPTLKPIGAIELRRLNIIEMPLQFSFFHPINSGPTIAEVHVKPISTLLSSQCVRATLLLKR